MEDQRLRWNVQFNETERIQIDNDSNLSPGYTPDHTQGDVLNDVTGILNYAFSNYELLVTATPTTAASPRRRRRFARCCLMPCSSPPRRPIVSRAMSGRAVSTSSCSTSSAGWRARELQRALLQRVIERYMSMW